MRLSTLRELAPLAGISGSLDEKSLRDTFLVTEPMQDLEQVLKKFLNTQAVLQSEEILARLTYEICEDAASEGIRILELRYAPTYILSGHPNLKLEGVHRAILHGLEMARQKLPIAVGLIAILQRTVPIEQSAWITDFVIDHKDSFLAIDLADNEEEGYTARFAPLVKRAKDAGLFVTIHAGEASYPNAARAVWDAIDYLGADRIGHGLQIHNTAKVVEYVSRRKIPLELCPTSNWLTKAVSATASHPIRKLMEAGVLVTINSDDPGIFDIDLTHEYELLAREQAFTEAEFTRCNDIAAAASFLPLAEKQKHWPRPIDESLVSRNR